MLCGAVLHFYSTELLYKACFFHADFSKSIRSQNKNGAAPKQKVVAVLPAVNVMEIQWCRLNSNPDIFYSKLPHSDFIGTFSLKITHAAHTVEKCSFRLFPRYYTATTMLQKKGSAIACAKKIAMSVVNVKTILFFRKKGRKFLVFFRGRGDQSSVA